MDNGNVKDLPDGVLLQARRTTRPGSTYQLVVWNFLDLGHWTWAMPGGNRLATTTVDGTAVQRGQHGRLDDDRWSVRPAREPGAATTTTCACHHLLVDPQRSGRLQLREHGQRPEQLDELPVGQRQRAQRDPVHAGVDPTAHHVLARTFTPIPDAGLPAAPIPSPILQQRVAEHAVGRDRCAQGRRHRAPGRHAGAGVRGDRRPHLRRRQVRQRAARQRRPAVPAVVPRRVRPRHRRMDPVVRAEARRHRLGPARHLRRQAHRRRSVHEHQRRAEHVGRGRARPDDRAT